MVRKFKLQLHFVDCCIKLFNKTDEKQSEIVFFFSLFQCFNLISLFDYATEKLNLILSKNSTKKISI